VVRVDPPAVLVANSSELELAAALGGLGVIMTFEEVLRPAFAEGTLVPLLQDWWQSFSGPFLYYPSRRHMPAVLRAFVDYVRSAAASASATRSTSSSAMPG
jgi:DNA-binding transcriptional LysR family regulator